ncbi:hypothetical protein KMW28_09745 [Flammeovirga yaeyamensis]|uniref:Uncharacterized protein n=1 Tax=Flammeovirga yaeyamensis TaxID=367791 RepID=A0AAX1N8P7_9BACT|nr:hypothetical protein [Flammeovirga yaeyamensis]MBB3698762.1 hypothetical protein [Flammeovirga yaeyamensis]NMF37347.1 hypothetical protein [Flammeovirga yaeyamensis]QWG03837.1 hypothetical protein KMW28_09745 [Flammeovirga yaeyamensis]
MEYVDLLLLYQNKDYLTIIETLSKKLDDFNKVSQKEFELWADCYIDMGKLDSAQSILSIAVIEEEIFELEEKLVEVNFLIKQLKLGFYDLKIGKLDTNFVKAIHIQLKKLLENNHLEEALLLMEDILNHTGEKQIPELWFGKLADQLFKVNERLIIYSKYKNILLDAIIYYYINTSKVYTENLSYIQKKRMSTFK